MSNELLRFEFPGSEKTRTFLRLSSLLQQLDWFIGQEHLHDHQTAMSLFFEIQDVANRGDQKNDIFQELERIRVYLNSLTNNLDVDQISLRQTLDEIHDSRIALDAVGLRLSYLSAQSEFLRVLRQRSAMPAASCEFDVPMYHHWLHLPAEKRREYIRKWTKPLLPYKQAIDLILRIQRSTTEDIEDVAVGGGYQKELQGKTFSLAQIYVDPSLNVVPKLSANRHLLTIRFTPIAFDKEPLVKKTDDIPFSLRLCKI